MQSNFEGIKKLRRGILILIIAIVLIAGAIVGFASKLIIQTFSSLFEIFTSILEKVISMHSSSSASVISALQPFASKILSFHFTTESITLFTVGLITLVLVAVGYFYIGRGFKALGIRAGQAGTSLFFSFLTSLIISVLILAGIYILKASSNLSLASNFPFYTIGVLGSVVIGGLGFLVLLISNILLGIGFYKVGVNQKEGLSRIGGILILLAGVIPFLFILQPYSEIFAVSPFLYFAGLAIVFAGLMRISPVKTAVQQTIQQPTAPQTQIYQVGQGVIRGDGLAFVTLYTSAQAMINSVKVEGTTLNALVVNPVILQPGQNAIAIKFDNVSQLIPGASYSITIGLKVGGNLIEVKAIANYYP